MEIISFLTKEIALVFVRFEFILRSVMTGPCPTYRAWGVKRHVWRGPGLLYVVAGDTQKANPAFFHLWKTVK